MPYLYAATITGLSLVVGLSVMFRSSPAQPSEGVILPVERKVHLNIYSSLWRQLSTFALVTCFASESFQLVEGNYMCNRNW